MIRWCAPTRAFGPGAGDAAVLRLKESKRALALATDGNGRWGFLAPRLGAMHAVAEAARNVACSGALPIAATNCLNFGNPEKPEVMWQFTEAIDGIAEACRASKLRSPAATSVSTMKRWASRFIPRRFSACWDCWKMPAMRLARHSATTATQFYCWMESLVMSQRPPQTIGERIRLERIRQDNPRSRRGRAAGD